MSTTKNSTASRCPVNARRISRRWLERADRDVKDAHRGVDAPTVDQVGDALGDENTGFVTEIPVVSFR